MSPAVDNKSETILNGDATEVSSGSVAPSTKHSQPSKKLCLPIQAVIHEYHMKHGLRHQDFFRYRGYCSRRLKHIRKSLKFTQTSHKKHFQKRPVNEDNIKDLRYLEILLLNAERAWAHSMQLKDESELEPRRIHHSIRKLTHACEISGTLLRICSADGPKCKVDPRTEIEAKAYHEYMEGILAQNKRHWSEALRNFKSALALYERIKLLVSEDKREPYDVQIAEVKPLINFCAYNLGENLDHSDTVAAELALDFEDKLKLMSKSNVANEGDIKATSFEWLGQKVDVKLPFWSSFLTSIGNYKQEISKALTDEAKIGFLDSLLDETRQIQAKLKEEAKQQKDSKPSPESNSVKMSNGVSSSVENPIMFLLGYVTFIKLANSIQKNIFFLYNLVSKESGKDLFGEASKKLKPQTFLKFFESCSEFIDEILAIEFVESFGSFQNFRDGLLTYQLAFSAFSIYELARCYGSQSEWKSSLALFSRAKEIARSVNLEGLTVMGMDREMIVQLIKDLISCVDAEIYNAYTLCISAQYAKEIPSQEKQQAVSSGPNPGSAMVPLDKTLDQWVKLTPACLKNLRITSLPPEYVPVPAKPLFFDIASNHVRLPSAVQEKVQASNQAKGGLGGYFRGWWGGSK